MLELTSKSIICINNQTIYRTKRDDGIISVINSYILMDGVVRKVINAQIYESEMDVICE